MATTIEQVIENIKNIKEEKDIYNEVVCAFGDYEYEGATKVVLSSDGCSTSEGEHFWYICYIDHADSPIIKFELEEVEEGVFSVLGAWKV